MAYTAGKSKHKETWDYWSLWNKKNRNVEKHFLEMWKQQMDEIRNICKLIEKNGEYIKADRFDHEEPYYAQYVGTVFNMTPSGKYYMPFASSNISVKEAAIDEFWREEFEIVLEEEGCWNEGGQGDPCDIFICKISLKKRLEDMTDEDHDRILSDIIDQELTAADLLTIPGVYEILSEYYNNDIIKKYEEED
jgi:hypothetical protein